MKKKIVFILTGGTIAMSVDEDSGGAVPGVDLADTIQNTLDLGEDFEIEIIEFGEYPSPHMDFDKMSELSRIASENLEKDDVTGVVVSHGTDTMEETAYYLELTTNSEKPIVLVGSMRNNSDLGYEGGANIASAIYTAASEDSKNKGVLVVMNDTIHSAYYVTKTHTTAVDTFKSIQFGELGYVSNKKPHYHRNIIERKYYENKRGSEKVGLIKCAAGIGSEIVDYYIENDYKGIVIEGLGAGNVYPKMVDGIKRAVDKDIPVILVSRCPLGSMEPEYAYEGGGRKLLDLGVISGGILLGHKARVKLSILLSNSYTLEEIRKEFENSLA